LVCRTCGESLSRETAVEYREKHGSG
jgi:hypothetical protein